MNSCKVYFFEVQWFEKTPDLLAFIEENVEMGF